MKILLINPPVYTPTTFPYSLAMMKGELLASLNEEVIVFDANAKFHFHKFKEFYHKLESNTQDYFQLLEQFYHSAKTVYSQISKDALKQKTPDGTIEIVTEIIEKKPDIVAISLSYNSQIFMTKKIVEELLTRNIKVVIGGPADYSKIIQENNQVISLGSSKELIKYLISISAKKRIEKTKAIPDFSDFNHRHYFTKEIVFALRTSISCPYQKCTFCTHHENKNYIQFDLSTLKETIQKNNIKKICFIDDDLTAKRLIEISQILTDLSVTWWCQLRPIKQIANALAIASKSGLKSVAWGLESANQRVLNLIQKGTNPKDITNVLKEAKRLEIINMVYILFGFPTETKEEFMDTILFLKENKEQIDLISPSIFGLQYGSKVLKSPELFDITKVNFEKRTLLSDKISYEIKSGLKLTEIKKLKKKYNHELLKINSVPNIISVFKEQVLNL